MQLHNLPKTTTKGLRRVGRGHGSGRVKTSGRGTKGQKARRDIKLHFEGGALPLIKRLPFLKGKGRNKHVKSAPVILNVKDFAGLKVLGDGEISVALIVKLPTSANAKTKIEKAGGEVVV